MKCVICKNGDTKNGKTTVTLIRGESTIIFKEVPAEICPNCGEYYLSEDVSGKLLSIAESAVKNGTLVKILRFAA